MIDEDKLDVEDVAINDNGNGQEENEYEQGMKTIEENQETVNEEDIYITEEEHNNEVENTDMEIN